MIFAEIEHAIDFQTLHAELVTLIQAHFSLAKSGIQGDSWIWIYLGEEKVEIDSFSSMRPQIKSAKPGLHVLQVVDVVQKQYKLRLYREPKLEHHEEP